MAIFSKSKNTSTMAKNNQFESAALNTLTPDTKIVGDIESIGDIRFDGTLEGNLVSKGKVVLGGNAKIKGRIECKIADISGLVEGTVVASELVCLQKSAKVYGDINMVKLSVEPGAIFTGSCKMSSTKEAVSSKNTNAK